MISYEKQTEPPSDKDSDKSSTLEDWYEGLNSSPNGLTDKEAQNRFDKYGPNQLSEQKENTLLHFLNYFWGPIPWMIEIAGILSALVHHWTDFTIILVLLLFNGLVEFFQEYQANNAIEALKNQLALQARVLRDTTWKKIEARLLVPGDIIKLRMGDIVPADAVLIDGDYLSVDQSALTGESLPVSKEIGGTAYSGSICKQGEMTALVTATGEKTFFGKTARLVSAEKQPSHFQQAVLNIGDYLIKLSLFLISILILVQLYRGDHFLTLIQFALILAVASIPVALPAVLSVTMAMGARQLSKMKAIVSRLESVEEMAGMNVLCSDKTGTLTQNKLTMDRPVVFGRSKPDDLMLAAGLASREENQDPIDEAVLNGLEDKSALKQFKVEKFVPFDPVVKRTEATVTTGNNDVFLVTKGAPQVILDLCHLEDNLKNEVFAKIDELARRGYRTLGVARGNSKKQWRFLGLIPLFDPPREDSAEMISRAREHGIDIKMITGDDVAIAKEISSQLGLGMNIASSADIFEDQKSLPTRAEEELENKDGFARVFPEHKYQIVKALQNRGDIVGMTGDGVNDAPALKQADVGIAVSGAADAARSAADLVLTAPGLSVIIKAVEEARRIFERMNSYAIYRITETIRIMLFMVLAMMVFDFYPITAVMIILLALLNDLPIMTIAEDHTWLDPKPVRWEMKRVLTVATVLGTVGVIETFFLLFLIREVFHIGLAQIQTIIFLKLVVAGHLTLFVARTKESFYRRPFPAPILLTAIVATQLVAALIAGLGIFVTAIPWSYVGYIWLYCIVWIFIEDGVKRVVYNSTIFTGKRYLHYMWLARKSLLSHLV